MLTMMPSSVNALALKRNRSATVWCSRISAPDASSAARMPVSLSVSDPPQAMEAAPFASARTSSFASAEEATAAAS